MDMNFVITISWHLQTRGRRRQRTRSRRQEEEKRRAKGEGRCGGGQELKAAGEAKTRSHLLCFHCAPQGTWCVYVLLYPGFRNRNIHIQTPQICCCCRSLLVQHTERNQSNYGLLFKGGKQTFTYSSMKTEVLSIPAAQDFFITTYLSIDITAQYIYGTKRNVVRKKKSNAIY